MPKEEWGTKRICPTTGRRFYDLNKTPIVSPYTGDTIEVDSGNKSRVLVADKPDAKTVAAEEASKKEAEVIDEEDVAEDAADADVDLGDDVLDDDDDDDVSLDEIADVAADDDDS